MTEYRRAVQNNASMVRGSGVVAILIKRLSDAIEDGDDIKAVIKGTAVNNDGASKASFTAPSVPGQAIAIRQALADADISPDTIRAAFVFAPPMSRPKTATTIIRPYLSIFSIDGVCFSPISPLLLGVLRRVPSPKPMPQRRLRWEREARKHLPTQMSSVIVLSLASES